MKVALVHDRLQQYGDPERLLTTLHHLYPQAPVYTAFVDRAQWGQQFADWDIRPTLAQRLPGLSQLPTVYRAWLPSFWESLDLSSYDLVISISGEDSSQSVLTRSHTLHISYCDTPPRRLWEPLPLQPQSRSGNWLQPRFRQYDFYAAQRVDRFVTHSDRVSRRIQKFYRRTAELIPPPVSVPGTGSAGRDYYLYVGELQPIQQVELAIRACQQLDRPLWIVGAGSERDRLQKLAGNQVRFWNPVSPAQLAEIYAGAIALIYPTAYEDFAMSPISAMGHGVPVIACDRSGLHDIILNFRTGLLFPHATVESLCEAMLQFEKLRFSAIACIERAAEFSTSKFMSRFEWFVAKALDDYHSRSPAPTEVI